MKRYVETFDNGPGGWFGWDQRDGRPGLLPLELAESSVLSRGPWWVDYNHAPPGGGYLHILFALHTADPEIAKSVGGQNRFIEQRFPTDFTDARITVRVKGDLELRGAQMVLLAQSMVGNVRINSVLTAQPIRVTRDWSEQGITCAADNGQWTCLGARHSAVGHFGWGPIAPVLRDINLDILFVLFPLRVVPAIPVPGDIHLKRAGRDYPVDETRLPSGCVMMDKIEIEFPRS